MIKCCNVIVDYSDERHVIKRALNKISVEFSLNEFTAVIGPNGSGKSTLARCLAGLISPTSGTITINGENSEELISSGKIRDIIGIVFQNPDDQLITNFVEREIAFALEYKGTPEIEMREKVREILMRFNLDSLKERSPNRLSGGQKQKLAVASIMVAKPVYLILDEPTSFLDLNERRFLFNQLREEFSTQYETGFTILLITQFSREAIKCDRVIVLNEGKIAADDTPEKIFSEKQPLLRQIGLEIPVEYRLKNSVPGIEIEPDIFDFSSAISSQ